MGRRFMQPPGQAVADPAFDAFVGANPNDHQDLHTTAYAPRYQTADRSRAGKEDKERSRGSSTRGGKG